MNYQGQKLKAQCLGNNVPAGVPLKSMSCHLMANAYLCGEGQESGVNFIRGRPQYAPPETYPNVFEGAVYYGKNMGQFAFPNTNLRFDLADLDSWETVVAESVTSQRYPNHTTYQRLMRRDQINAPFENLSNVSWTTADLSAYDHDWLGNLMPGGWCYTSRGVPEPMRGEVYYEDARKTNDPLNVLDKSQSSVRENWTPFCTPLNVYNQTGSLLGTFDGLSYILFFNLAAVKVPLQRWQYSATVGDFVGENMCGVLPRDKTLFRPDDGTPLPWLNPKRQILSIEAWFYLNSSSPTTFKSPRFATCRWWHYTKGLGYLDAGPLNSPFTPYFFLRTLVAPEAGFLQVPITFPLLLNENNPESLASVSRYLHLYNFQMFFGA